MRTFAEEEARRGPKFGIGVLPLDISPLPPRAVGAPAV